MKLVYCKKCHDVFKLDSADEIRTCKCKLSKGYYITSNDVEIFGEHAVPLCIGWTSFYKAIENRPKDEQANKENPAYFKAWIPPRECNSIDHTE